MSAFVVNSTTIDDKILRVMHLIGWTVLTAVSFEVVPWEPFQVHQVRSGGKESWLFAVLFFDVALLRRRVSQRVFLRAIETAIATSAAKRPLPVGGAVQGLKKRAFVLFKGRKHSLAVLW